jgi:SP family arabinose:H+ symporter-like MFS transporter
VEEAKRALNQTAGTAASSELAAIEESLASDRIAGSQPLFSRRYRVPVMLAIVLALFNQFSGINPILYYLNDILRRPGLAGSLAICRRSPSAQPICFSPWSQCPS